MNFEDVNIYQPLDFEGNQWIRGKKLTYNSGSFNSYIQILAEGGLLMFIPFSVIMLFPIYKLVVNPLMPNEKTPFLISFICMSIHLYFIAAIVNMWAWFLIGITLAALKRKNTILI